MDKNFVLTSNYVRANSNQSSKKTSTLKTNLLDQSNESNELNDSHQHQQKYIMNRGISGPSSKEKDIKNISKITDNKNIRVTRINIDSRYRVIESKNMLDTQIYYLDPNPITITPITITSTNTDYSDLTITHKNHPFSLYDNIIIQGVQASHVYLNNAMTFIANSTFVRINHNAHNINFFTTNNMYIQITGFIGNQFGNSLYNNIPINEINRLFQILPTASEQEIQNKNYYYINMDSIIANFSETYSLSTISIIFKDINGINLNLINANYPTSYQQLNGFQKIYKITPDSYSIQLNIINNLTITNCGGNAIWVCKVIDFFEGYTNNNFYKIPLKKTFYNVQKIKLISTEFPNTEKVIKSIPPNKKNNVFYWNLRRDGNKIYSVEIEPGNYSVNLLIQNLKNAIQLIKRDVIDIFNKNINGYSYYNYNLCDIKIIPETDLFSIQFNSIIFIPNSITYKDATNYTDNRSRLIINHPDHRLVPGLIITINGAISTNGIPQDVLNSSFVIEKIIDYQTYQVILPIYKESSDKTITNGGKSIDITYPAKSKLYFDKLDTIGNLIGYRNVGTPYAITNYSYINKNTDPYEYDNINANAYINNSINLSGDNYILFTSPIFKESFNTGLIGNIFAKLLLSGDPGTVIYNQFIQLGETFSVPIPSLSEWEASFYDPIGNLYNFGNLEHSYTLEIYEELKTN